MKSRKQHGFTLFEVLITIFILAIGLLGMAALQATGIRYSHSSYLRSQATFLADDLIDRMRANRPGGADFADLNSYTVDELANFPVLADITDCSSTSCDVTEMAEYDLAQWKDTFEARLPGGDVSNVAITVDANTRPANVQVMITLQDEIGLDERETIEDIQFSFLTQL